GAKTPTWSQALLREKTTAQLAVGQAEGLVCAGRAFLTETLRDAWATVTGGTALSWEQRGLLWLASTQAATQAVQAVELLKNMYTSYGQRLSFFERLKVECE